MGAKVTKVAKESKSAKRGMISIQVDRETGKQAGRQVER
jgi:hypothetical protein